MSLVFGVDEAGRGPILGPMAIAVVGLERGASIALRRRGVADSKGFGTGATARERRAALAELIRARAARARVRLVSVERIDGYTFHGRLNELEREVVLELLAELDVPPDAKIICDGARLFDALRDRYANLVAVDRGESAHVAVAAASILAKDARDRAFGEIAERYASEFGPLTGGGYLNAATYRFLDAYRARFGGLPPEARKSWGAPKIAPTAVQLSLLEDGSAPTPSARVSSN